MHPSVAVSAVVRVLDAGDIRDEGSVPNRVLGGFGTPLAASYVAPTTLSPMAQAQLISALGGALMQLTNDINGDPIYVSGGFVESGRRQIDRWWLRFDRQLSRRFATSATAIVLDGDLPLQPRRQLSGDLRYLGDGVDLRAAVRWVDDLDLLSVDTVL